MRNVGLAAHCNDGDRDRVDGGFASGRGDGNLLLHHQRGFVFSFHLLGSNRSHRGDENEGYRKYNGNRANRLPMSGRLHLDE